MAAIIYPSALEYWLKETGIPYYFHFDKDSCAVKNKEVLQMASTRSEISHAIDWLCFTAPVHVAVSRHTRRNNKESIIFHKMPDHLPEHSFYKITDEIYIASPELCFIQAACELSVSQLILLANDLCAIYVKDTLEEYGQRRRNPVTDTKTLKTYLNKAGQVRGIRNARSLIRHVSDRSNSPMESRLAVLAALPLSRGGYGLIKPQLNLNIPLSKATSEYTGITSCCCDMVWKTQKVILEYDSNLSHLDIRQHFKDKQRSTALALDGFKVISITAEQLSSFHNVERTFLGIRDSLKMQTHKDRMESYFSLRWKVVHEILQINDPTRFHL